MFFNSDLDFNYYENNYYLLFLFCFGLKICFILKCLMKRCVKFYLNRIKGKEKKMFEVFYLGLIKLMLKGVMFVIILGDFACSECIVK